MAFYSMHEVLKISGCPQGDNAKRELTEDSDSGRQEHPEHLCDVVEMAKIPKQSNTYSLIKIEFTELEDPTLLNAANIANYVGVELKSKNGELRHYIANLSAVFFVTNLVNLVAYCVKLCRVPVKEIGQIQVLVLIGLILVQLFNTPYKLFMKTEMHLFDTGINALSETCMLFINLALAHGIYAADSGVLIFYTPKVVLCILVFLGLWSWSYTDVRKFESILQKDFAGTEEAEEWERNCFTFFLCDIVVYAIVATYLSLRAYKAKKATSRGEDRFQPIAGTLILISGCTVSLVVIPFESQVLRFINENGVVNIYLIIISYMFLPDLESRSEEKEVGDSGNVSEVNDILKSQSKEDSNRAEKYDTADYSSFKSRRLPFALPSDTFVGEEV